MNVGDLRRNSGECQGGSREYGALGSPKFARVRQTSHEGAHMLLWAIPPVRLALSRRNSGKIPERPRKRSQSVSWNSPRENSWDAPKLYNSRHLRLPRAFPEFSPPQYGWGRLFFSEVVLERASQSRSWNSQQYWAHFWYTLELE